MADTAKAGPPPRKPARNLDPAASKPRESATSLTGPYQVSPLLTREKYAELRESIRRHGMLVPVDVDEDGHILDGHHRQAAADELGIPPQHRPRPRVITGLDGDDAKRGYALVVNLVRRQLTPSQRQQQLRLLRHKGWSIRRIARETGIPPATVGRDVAGVPSETPAPGGQPPRITGLDGKRYQATPRTRPLQVKPKTSGPSLLAGRLAAGQVTEQARELLRLISEWRPSGKHTSERAALAALDDLAAAIAELREEITR